LGLVPGSATGPVEFRFACGDKSEKFEADPGSEEGWKNVSSSLCPCEEGIRVSAAPPKAGAWLGHPSFENNESPRLVVFLLIDALRADVLGAYGNSPSPSPEIDKMASQGAVFDKAYTASPFTLTSVASIFTGAYPWQHKVMFSSEAGLVLSDPVPKLVEKFQNAGYHTAAFSGTYFFMSRNGYAEGFDHFDETCAGAFFRESAACLNKRMVPWIKHHRNRDVFLYIHYVDPHAPYYPPEKYRQKHVGSMDKPFFDDVALGEIGQFGSHRAWYQFWRSPSEYDLKYLRALYLSEVEYIDEKAGNLVSELRSHWSSAGKDNGEALFLVTADHGEAFYEHGAMDHVADIHEPVMRVPFIMFGDGVPQGKVINEQVRTIDFMPTLLDLSGLSVEDDIPGRSLKPLLRGKKMETGPAAAVHFLGMDPEYALVKWPWKLFSRPADGEFELYDLEKDPSEKNNLAEQKPGKQKEMERLLEGILDLPELGREEKAEPVDRQTQDRLKALGY
jgi:arylsulfatase A-like enzyme